MSTISSENLIKEEVHVQGNIESRYKLQFFNLRNREAIFLIARCWVIVLGFNATLQCKSSPDKHVFLYLFPDSLCTCIIIHFSVYPTTIRARVLCLFAQVCKRKNPVSEPRLDLAVILATSRYEHNTLSVNSEQ